MTGLGRYLMKVRDSAGRERYVDVPRLWTVEPDEEIFDLEPPPEWHFAAGQRLKLIDDDLVRWEVEVVEDTHEDWEIPCRILGPSFIVERFGRFYDDVEVVLEVPRQRLIDEERLAALDRVDEVIDKALDPKTGLLRKLSFDECEVLRQEITAARDALPPLFGGLVPHDSHVGHYQGLCDYYLWRLEEWLEKMPKQLSLFGGTVERPVKKKAKGRAEAAGQQAAPPRCTEQMVLFN